MAHEAEAGQSAKDNPGLAQPPIDFLRTDASLGYAGQALCPLHLAMQELARATVSQLVYYAEGEYALRPDLMRELNRWRHARRLIANGVCPALRTEGDPAVALHVACSLMPEDRLRLRVQRSAVAPNVIRAIPARSWASRSCHSSSPIDLVGGTRVATANAIVMCALTCTRSACFPQLPVRCP